MSGKISKFAGLGTEHFEEAEGSEMSNFNPEGFDRPPSSTREAEGKVESSLAGLRESRIARFDSDLSSLLSRVSRWGSAR
jgi:hypothetical protein